MTCPQTSLAIRIAPMQITGILEGHLDSVAASLLGTLAERVEHNPGRRITLVVSEVGDSTPPGVAALLALQKAALAVGSSVLIDGASPDLSQTLTTTGLGSLLTSTR